MRPKNKNCFSPISSNQFIRKMAKVLKSGINLTLTIAVATKMSAKKEKNRKVTILEQISEI